MVIDAAVIWASDGAQFDTATRAFQGLDLFGPMAADHKMIAANGAGSRRRYLYGQLAAIEGLLQQLAAANPADRQRSILALEKALCRPLPQTNDLEKIEARQI